jgi:hypothetical protein
MLLIFIIIYTLFGRNSNISSKIVSNTINIHPSVYIFQSCITVSDFNMMPLARFLALISVRGWVHSQTNWVLATDTFNDLIGNKTRDLPASSVISQPNELTRGFKRSNMN